MVNPAPPVQQQRPVVFVPAHRPSLLWGFIKLLCALAFLAVCGLVLVFCVGLGTGAKEFSDKMNAPPVITLSEFNRIRDGMTLRQAVEVVGEAGTLDASGGEGEHRVESYRWQNADGSNAGIMLQGDRVNVKAQAGLERHP